MSYFGGDPIKVAKLDAARRELKTAIELWFADGDLVSIHALAFAAQEIIHFVSKHRNRDMELIFDSILIKDEYRRDWKTLISKEANFFKHADRDPDPEGTIDLLPGMPMFFLMFSVIGLSSMGEKLTPAELAFLTWLSFNHPELLTEQGRKLYADPFTVEQLQNVRELSKREFFDQFMSASVARPRGVTIGHIQLPDFDGSETPTEPEEWYGLD